MTEREDGRVTEVTALYPWIAHIDSALTSIAIAAGLMVVLLALILWRVW
jgi:hypothetical protein